MIEIKKLSVELLDDWLYFFCIAPSARGKGIATKLLNKICEDAKRDSYDCIEAYPFDNEENNAYHGPTSMYVNNGFIKRKHLDGVTVYRKMI